MIELFIVFFVVIGFLIYFDGVFKERLAFVVGYHKGHGSVEYNPEKSYQEFKMGDFD